MTVASPVAPSGYGGIVLPSGEGIVISGGLPASCACAGADARKGTHVVRAKRRLKPRRREILVIMLGPELRK
jgi:hypothetical protein